MSRAQTLVLALLIMNVLLGSLCLAVARGERASSALRDWGTSCLIYAIGLLITQQRYLPSALTATVGNALIAWAPVWAARGALTYCQRQPNWSQVNGFLGVTIAVIVLDNFWWHSALVNFVAPAPIAIILFAVGATSLLRSPINDAHSASQFMAGMMWFAVIVWTLRIATLLGAMDLHSDRERADFIIALFAIAQLVVSVATTMALFWIEVRRMEAALTKVAFSDALTELPNRRATIARFQEEAQRAARSNHFFALMVIDLDHFKRINDTYGHLAGDAVLKHAASTLGSAIPPNDLLGRIGGEEFAVLLTAENVEKAMSIAERLRSRIQHSVCNFANQSLRVTLSAGVALFPNEGRDWDSLLAVADARCYASKQAGRNCVTGASWRV
jgi:diguanylate cyclase (GGDEF)-like protein